MKVLIIGSGVAGTCLAHRFIAKGIDFKIVDKGINQSTKVAGGIINPMVFRRMTLSWRAEEFMPVCRCFLSGARKTIQHNISISACYQALICQ